MKRITSINTPDTVFLASATAETIRNRTKQRVVAFVGSCGRNIAMAVSELPEMIAHASSTDIKMLVVMDWKYWHSKLPKLPADYLHLLSESFALYGRWPFSTRLEQAKAELMNFRSIIRHEFESLIVVAGLGGQTGTFAGGAISELADDEGIPVTRILVTPFNFEGDRKLLAEKFIKLSSRPSYTDIVFHNVESIRVASTTSVAVAHRHMNERVAREIVKLLEK